MGARILVTSAGAGPGVALVKAIKRTFPDNPFVIAVDRSPRAAGLYLADQHYLVPSAEAPEYIPTILDLCVKNGIQMVIPIFDTETPIFARDRAMFEAQGIYVAVNSSACVASASDKAKAYEICRTHGICQPRFFPSPTEAPQDAFPLYGKPAVGRGGQGHICLESLKDATHIEIPPGFMWQELVKGTEYSIDTFGGVGEYFAAAPRERIVIRAGQTVVGKSVVDDELIQYARKVCKAFGATEVCCLQVIRTPEGSLQFIELNPRYGTGVPLSIRAGINFPLLQWMHGVDSTGCEHPKLSLRDGIHMIRYWEEIYLDEQGNSAG